MQSRSEILPYTDSGFPVFGSNAFFENVCMLSGKYIAFKWLDDWVYNEKSPIF